VQFFISNASFWSMSLIIPDPPFILGLVTSFQAAKGGFLAFTSPVPTDNVSYSSLFD
jgi:hypothetical protein